MATTSILCGHYIFFRIHCFMLLIKMNRLVQYLEAVEPRSGTFLNIKYMRYPRLCIPCRSGPACCSYRHPMHTKFGAIKCLEEPVCGLFPSSKATKAFQSQETGTVYHTLRWWSLQIIQRTICQCFSCCDPLKPGLRIEVANTVPTSSQYKAMGTLLIPLAKGRKVSNVSVKT